MDAVVEGTVQRSGNRVRITAQLLEARTDRHLWAETYVRDSGEIIRLEEQTALAIAHEVSGRLTTDEETRLASKRTVNPRAYDAYLHGRYLWNERTSETAVGARVYFEQALREDPGFALAYSGLADYYAVSWYAEIRPTSGGNVRPQSGGARTRPRRSPRIARNRLCLPEEIRGGGQRAETGD